MTNPSEQTPNPYSLSNQPKKTAAAASSDRLFYAVLGTRLLGLFFAIDGLCGLAGSLVNGGLQQYVYWDANLEPESDPYVIGYVVTYVGYLSIGLHLLLNPRWTLRMFLLSETTLNNNNNLET